MSLVDTGKAIGKVTELLRQHLQVRTALTVTVGRPEPPSTGPNPPAPRLNLFLYEAHFDPSLRNTPLDAGQQPPLWLVLRYLLTSFDSSGSSDSVLAQEQMGEGLRALQEVSFLSLSAIALPAPVIAALKDNPEPLKVTFEDTTAELLAKIMQGSDEKYRFSTAFQVRPVMIATAEPPAYGLLVGVDYTATPAARIGVEGVHIPLLPSLGPVLESVAPASFEAGASLTLRGTDLNLAHMSVSLGGASLAVTAQAPNSLTCTVNGAIPGGTLLSAGSLPLAAVVNLPGGRTRSSNLLVAALLPKVTAASTSGLHAVAGGKVAGNIRLDGNLLGTEHADIFLALYQNGAVAGLFDSPFTFAADQTSLTLAIPNNRALPSGAYRVILRVNGQQALNSPTVNLV